MGWWLFHAWTVIPYIPFIYHSIVYISIFNNNILMDIIVILNFLVKEKMISYKHTYVQVVIRVSILDWKSLCHGEHMIMYLIKVNKNSYSPHNVSTLWALKNYFVHVSSNLLNSMGWTPYQGLTLDSLVDLSAPKTPNRNFLYTLQNGPATHLHPVS